MRGLDGEREEPAVWALHPEPDRLVELIPAALRERVHVSRGGEVVSVADVWNETNARARSSEARAAAFALMVDGPREALRVVAAAVARHPASARIAVSMADAAPPAWWVLDVFAEYGVEVGVDLRSVRWHDSEGLWWTSPEGPAFLPLQLDKPGDIVVAATVLARAAGVGDSPIGDWLGRVERAEVRAGPTEWDRALCAQFTVEAATHLVAGAAAQPHGASLQRPSSDRSLIAPAADVEWTQPAATRPCS